MVVHGGSQHLTVVVMFLGQHNTKSTPNINPNAPESPQPPEMVASSDRMAATGGGTVTVGGDDEFYSFFPGQEKIYTTLTLEISS